MAPSAADAGPSARSDVSFVLPDRKTRVAITGDGPSYVVTIAGTPAARWTEGEAVRVSPAMVQDERASMAPVLQLEMTGADARLEAVWTAIYALWLHPLHRDDDIIPAAVPHALVDYLCCTGLARISPFAAEYNASPGSSLLWLAHEAFWQGAGAPDSLSWLQARPETRFAGFNGGLGAFASQLSFTRQGNVCTVHPLRPPKPSPGTIVYSRYIVELEQHLDIVHIDAANAEHFAAYARWQNSDRVNAGWKERGSDDKHRAYLAAQLADPHSMSCLFLWDGQPAGYCELGWAKEDNMACFVGANCGITLGPHDQNSHILVGEERFRGGKRYQAVATSIKHTCFLRDPRTQQVVAEPRIDLPSVPIQDRFLPQEKKKRFHLPHKEAMLFCLCRDRFFQEAHFC